MDDDIDYEPGKSLVDQGYKKLLGDIYEKCLAYERLGSHSISFYIKCTFDEASKLISDLRQLGIKAEALMIIDYKEILFRFTW